MRLCPHTQAGNVCVCARIQMVFFPTDIDKERLNDIRRRRKGSMYEPFDERNLSVSYSAG